MIRSPTVSHPIRKCERRIRRTDALSIVVPSAKRRPGPVDPTVNRRTVLRRVVGGGVASLAGPVAVRGSASGSPEEGDGRPANTLLPGTPHETGVYVASGTTPGPTALVVGGIHGDERPGYRAAERFVDVDPARGTVIVVPRANRVAIEAGTRTGEHGDLNRKFPTGTRPTTSLARAIWGVVERRDPDVVVDLHRSVGLYAYHDASVGQAVFPTDAGDAPDVAAAVVETLNEEVVPWSMPLHDFRRGNLLTGTRPMLVHKVAGDRSRPGYIVETTRFLVDTGTQTEWAARAAVALLAGHGVDYGASSPVDSSGGWRWS